MIRRPETMHFTSLSVKIRRNFHIEIGGGGYREEINKTKTSGASYIFFHTTKRISYDKKKSHSILLW